MGELVFGNELILRNIFSFVDFETAKQMRLVSSNFARAGLWRFKRDQNIYFNFKMRGSYLRNGKILDRDKIWDFFTEPENIWSMKRLKLSISEIMCSEKLRIILITHGHNTTHMNLIGDKREIINESFYELFLLLLKSWCPNLEHLTITHLPGIKVPTSIILDMTSLSIKLKFLEIMKPDPCYDDISKVVQATLIGRLIYNSPNLKMLKVGQNSGDKGEWLFNSFCHLSNLTTNIEILEHGDNTDVMRLNYLTRERCPRMKKLVMNSENQGLSRDFRHPQFLPPSVNLGITEVHWTNIYFYEEYIPVLLSLFPNVQKLALENFSIYDDKKPKTVFEANFPKVKTLLLKFGGKVMLLPRTIKSLLKMMPGVERLEFSAADTPFYLKVILKGLENAESINQLDLGLGENFKDWVKQDVLDRFPKHIRMTIHK